MINHLEDARVHCVVLKVRAVPSPQPALPTSEKVLRLVAARRRHPVPQDPTACNVQTRPVITVPTASSVLSNNYQRMHQVKCSTHELPAENVCLRTGFWITPKCYQMLLRKEVIQPHLPVRLPCYDLVLITNPTFDGSPQ